MKKIGKEVCFLAAEGDNSRNGEGAFLTLRDGSILKAFALLGYGKLAEAEETVKAVRALDPYHFDLFIFDAQKGRICK